MSSLSQFSARSVRHGIASCQLLCTLGGERGLKLAQLLRDTGITPTQLADPASEVDAAQELALIRNLVTQLGDPPGLGLAAGARYHLTTMGIWGFALVSSTSLRSALQAGLSYLDLTYSFSRIWLEELDDRANLVIDVDAAPAELQRFLVERDMAAIMSFNREILAAPLVPHSVGLRFAKPPRTQAYRAAFKLQPQFGAARNFLALDSRLLDRRLPQANPQVREACEAQCRALLARRRSRAGIAGRVRDRLLRAPQRMPDMEAIAAEFCMSSRQLRRRLDDERTSFRALADEVRQALAEQLLRSPRLKLDDIAERLGYADRASFMQAFKRWTGSTPGAFRVS